MVLCFFFLDILIHPDLFWNDGHNLPQRTKQSIKCSVQNPLVKYLANWLPPVCTNISPLARSVRIIKGCHKRIYCNEEMGNAISAFKVKQTSWVALQKSGIKLYAYHSRKVHVYTTCCTDADQDQKIEMDIHKI